MSLTGKAVQYLQQQFPSVSFLQDIILQDDGEGPYIKYWGIGTPQPTEQELNEAADRATINTPRPSTEEQLNLIYRDMKYGTKSFVDTMDKFQ